MTITSYETLKVRQQESVCFVEIDRPQAKNTINAQLIGEMNDVLRTCEESSTVVVLSGSPEVFCFGADFGAIAGAKDTVPDQRPDDLYDLWMRMATGPYVTVSHVRGQANAGGVGFVAASDIVLADQTAQFSLSELLFGLYPACVLPFLIRRIGFAKANYLTLTTQPLTASQALECGLADAVEAQSDVLVRRHLQRLRRLSKTAIARYKRYMSDIGQSPGVYKAPAVAANCEMFANAGNLAAITRYVERGVFPWET